MPDYLVFRLYGPLASWGDIAVGESRHSSVQPSRSALLGLLAAALGVPRDDEAGQAALTAGYRFGIKLLAVGWPLRDYHTVQAPPQQKKITYRTRRQETADKEKLGTLLSAREYRCDSLATIAVEALPGAPADLPALAAALERPRYPLYLGRKSCPLATLLQPRQMQADDLKTALDSFDAVALLPHDPAQYDSVQLTAYRRFVDRSPRYFWEEGMTTGLTATLTQRRHDQPTSRKRWQFAPRNEHVHLGSEPT